MAKWTPSRSRPGIGRSRGTVAPVAIDDGVVPAAQLLPRDVRADGDAGAEPGALGLHLLQPAVQLLFFHLEVGDAVAQQAADLVVALVHGHGVAHAGQLLGGGEPGGAGADDGDRLAGQARRAAAG